MASLKKFNGSTWVDSKLRKYDTDTDTLTTLPVNIYANDTTATVGLKGNTAQNGTPTPDNPIMPQGTGERTAQLFEDKIANCSVDAGGKLISNHAFDMYIAKVEKGVTYTASAKITGGFYTTKPIIGDISYNGQRMAFAEPTVTAPITGYMAFRVNSGSDEPMLNTGNIALPYEPYGYKLDISSANTTTPIYLGEVQTERKIGKLVLTSTTVDWTYDSTYNRYVFRIADSLILGVRLTPVICSHFTPISDGRPLSDVPNNSIYSNAQQAVNNWFIKTEDYTTAASFKQFLDDELAAGTPVTVWYVLAEPETGIVNEPLMKIGDYADSISGITIPTITGKDTFDVETTLKPSEVSLSYTGWHDASVKEWDGSQWQ